MTTYVTNFNKTQVNVRVNTPEGLHSVYVAPNGRVALAEGHTVDQNWLANQTKIKVSITPTPAP